MQKKHRMYLLVALCIMLMSVLWLSAGCSADPEVVASMPADTAIGTTQPSEETFPDLDLVPYEGNAIVEGYTGTNLGGYPYVLPAANLDELGSFGERFDQWVNGVALTNNGIWQGKPVIPAWDFANYGGILVSEYSEGKDQVFYDYYTDSYLNGMEFASIFMGQDAPMLKESIIETITWMYKDAANTDAKYTPAGLERTCANEHLETIEVSVFRNGRLSASIQFLDDRGNPDGIDHYVLDMVVQESWPVEYSSVWIKDGTLFINYAKGGNPLYGSRDTIYIPVIVKDGFRELLIPGAEVVENMMLSEIAAYLDKYGSDNLQVSSSFWSAGRYFVFEFIINNQQPIFYYIDLVTGEAETAEEVYASMSMDREILNSILLPRIDTHYQKRCSEITGEPFNWVHDEALYQKTLSAENLQNILVLPCYGSCLKVYVPAWYPGSETATMECLNIELFESIRSDYGDSYINVEEVLLYPGLMELLVSQNGKIGCNGYMDYMAWQHENVLVVAIGWFGPNNDTFGYDLCSIDLNTGMWLDCNETLEYLGQDFGSFRSFVMDALKLKLEAKGKDLANASIQENDTPEETNLENLAEEDDGITEEDAKELAAQFWGFESVEDLQKDGDLFVDVIDELEEEGVLYYAVALQTPRHGRLSTMDIVYVNTVTEEVDYFF